MIINKKSMAVTKIAKSNKLSNKIEEDVLLDPDGNRVIITNGAALISITCPSLHTDVVPQILEYDGQITVPTLVRTKVLSKAAKNIPSHHVVSCENMFVSKDEGKVEIKSTDLETVDTVTAKVDDSSYYPPVVDIMESLDEGLAHGSVQVGLSVHHLHGILAAVKQFDSDSTITLTVLNDSNPVRVTAKSGDQDLTAYIMPMLSNT